MIFHRNNTHFYECRSNNAINKNCVVVAWSSWNARWIRKKIRKEFTISSSSTSSAFIHAKYGWWQATDMCTHIIFYVSAEENIPRGVAWMLLEVTVYEFIVCQFRSVFLFLIFFVAIKCFYALTIYKRQTIEKWL